MVIIELTDGTSYAKVSSIGATLLSWNVAGREVIDGYVDETELRTLDGYRCAVLTPWSNRLAGARWIDDDAVVHDVEPICGDEGLHGLFTTYDFQYVRGKNWVELNGGRQADDVYPFDISVCVRYEIEGDLLRFSLTTTNNSDRRAPITLGWHPYFLVESLDDAVVTVPGDYRILVDRALIPLPGEEAFVKLSERTFALDPDDDFAVTGLSAMDGSYTATLKMPDRMLAVSFNADDAPQALGRALFHLYSGGNLIRGRNASVAIEPCAAMTDSYNRPEIVSQILREPGEMSKLHAEVRCRVTQM
ncbi:aldose 1-epimerase [Trueperella pyogenes]|uniref:aldose 1-epimerase n=1 Tax=Trueperella pyogenes TaxID=1661 RepID=UPI00057F26BE|nr:aldose 1-epimerase [Trueperella pyogenes]AJC70699.1 hypothetical protein X956_08960 [Trueperella pyogenes TP8]MBB3025120.1 aldose 1-epimerase [Trueperella pyogenes]SUO87959.1 putative aldose-1-epimerase [Trueperella pyogenes]